MQENTPATPAQVEIKGVEIKISKPRRKVIKLNDDMWGSYKYLEGIASSGDLLILLKVIRLNNDGTYAIVVKVINMNDKITDNGKVNVDGME